MSEAKTYSHYCWRLEEFPQAEFDKFMSDAVKVLLKCEPMLLIRQMSGECISFQGIEKQLSPFSFSRQYKFNDEFPFRDSTNPERVFFGVRTDKLPFDEVVVAVLLLAKLHFNNGLRLNRPLHRS
jgi:hypothetical protein